MIYYIMMSTASNHVAAARSPHGSAPRAFCAPAPGDGDGKYVYICMYIYIYIYICIYRERYIEREI